MKVAFETGTFASEGYRFEDYIKLASELGFEDLELWIDRANLWPYTCNKDKRRRFKEIIDQYNLTVRSICPIPFSAEGWKEFDFEFNIAHPDEERRRKGVEFYNMALDLAADLDTKSILILPGKVDQPNFMKSPTSYRIYWNQSIKSLKECVKKGKDLGVCLGVENAVVGNFLDRPEELLKTVDIVGSDHLKVYLDIANANVFYPPIEYIEILKDTLLDCIHVSDNDGIYPQHLPIGMGNIDYPKILQSLKEIGWNGYLVLEIFYSKDSKGGIESSKQILDKIIAEYLSSSSKYLRKI